MVLWYYPPRDFEMSTRLHKLVTAVFAILIGTFSGLMLLTSLEIIFVSRPVAVTEALLGATLSAITAYLLYSQTRIFRRQADIEEKMLAFETEPSLEVVDKKFRGNDVIVEIANYGHGIAQELELQCQVTCPDIEWYNGVPYETPLKRYDPDEERTFEDSSVRPQEEPTTYIAESVRVARTIRDADTDFTESGFETLLRELSGEDGDVSVHLEVRGQSTVKGEYCSVDVCDDFTADLAVLSESPSLQEVYQYQNQ